jgi:putative NIF3 family GTP cyclohydrolase 1 type 2
LKYHEAREAEEINMTVIDAGHQCTEQIICSFLPDLLEGEFRKRSWQVKILSFRNHPYIKNI